MNKQNYYSTLEAKLFSQKLAINCQQNTLENISLRTNSKYTYIIIIHKYAAGFSRKLG